MNGKFPVRSEYTTPENLSANAAEQKIFAVESSSSSTMILGSRSGWGKTCTGAWTLCWLGSERTSSRRGITGIPDDGIVRGVSLRRVLLIPCLGRFMWPFAVAGLGFRYFRMSFSFMLGHPRRNPRRTALRSVEILGLHNDWWANLTPLPRVRTEWLNAARSTPW